MTGLRTGGMTATWKIFGLFVLLAVVGTLSHEFGHIAVARWLGYQTRLHYAAMSYEYENEIYAGRCGMPPTSAAEDVEAYAECRRRAERRDGLLISLGGPLQTMLTGTIGLAWLLWDRRKRAAADPLGRAGWCAALLALFWSRQVFNQLTAGIDWIRGTRDAPAGGDEARIAEALNIPVWSVSAPTALIGLAVCLAVVGYGVPAPLRRRFFSAGVAGSMLGFGLWMNLIGPYLLP